MKEKKLLNLEKVDKKGKKMLTISFPNDLYQLLLEKSGKGNIGNYIREAVEAKLKEEEIDLTRAYRELEENFEYQTIGDFFKRIWKDKDYLTTSPEKKSQRQKKE